MYPLFRRLLLGTAMWSLAGLTSCSKDAAAPTASTAELLTGHWQLTASTNGMSGQTTPADPSQRRELIFTSGGQMTSLLNGIVQDSKSYSLVQQESALSQKLETYLVTPSLARQIPQKVSVDATTLTLSLDVYDGPTTTSKRWPVSGGSPQ